MADSKGTGWEQITIADKPDVLMTFAGLSLTLKSSHAWAVALAAAIPSGAKGGVGQAFAVVGPNAKLDVPGLADALAPHFSEDDPKRIHVVAHSSGVEYARNFLDALAKNEDAKTAKRIIYYNVDGGNDAAKVKQYGTLLGQAFAVSGHLDAGKDTIQSRNYDSMKALGASLQKMGVGKFVDLDLGSKKDSDKWPPDGNILHMALINFAKPVWFVKSKPQSFGKDYAPFYPGGDINSTYATCTKDNVTADYIVK